MSKIAPSRLPTMLLSKTERAIPVNSLVGAMPISQRAWLRDHIDAVDTNGDGVLSVEEVADVVSRGEKTSKKNRRLTFELGLALACLVLSIIVNVSLTWKFVDDAKGTETNRAGELMAAGSLGAAPKGTPVQVVQQARILPLGILPLLADVSHLNAIRFSPEPLPIIDELHPESWRVTGHEIVQTELVWDITKAKVEVNPLFIVELTTAAGGKITIRNPTDGEVTRPDGTTFPFCAACVPFSMTSTLEEAALDEVQAKYDSLTTTAAFSGTNCDPDVALEWIDTQDKQGKLPQWLEDFAEAKMLATRGHIEKAEFNFNGANRSHVVYSLGSPGTQVTSHFYHDCHAGYDDTKIFSTMPGACNPVELQKIVDDPLINFDTVGLADDILPAEPKCHPASSMLELESGKRIRIDEVAVGEMIRTPAGFEPVLGFMQAEPGVIAEYVALSTTSTTVMLSPNHWLPIDGTPADPLTAKVGDVLTTADEAGGSSTEAITKVQLSARGVGAYHLFTRSGQYYVDGVAATTYAYHPIPLWAWDAFGTKYVQLRYNIGLPVSPATGAPGELPMDYVAGLYHGKVPELVEVALFPVTIGSAIAIELYNAVFAGAGMAPSAVTMAATTATVGSLMCARATKAVWPWP